MKYNLYELADNKELCKEVIEKKFTIKTSIDSLKALDFANLSMRQNHIKAYEEMYEIGGKELFDAILEDGKTSLTKNPNAAKVGVVPVKGADGFYLKSNVSALVAFMSIINGLKLLDEADGIYFQDEEDEQEDWEPLFQLDEFEDDEDNAGDEEDEQDDWEPLFELDENEDSAEFEDGDEPEEVEENEEDDEDMKKDTIPQAKDYSVVGSKIIDNKTGEEVNLNGYLNIDTDNNIIEPIYIGTQFIGYKYKSTLEVDVLEEHTWGFISESFLDVTACIFDGFSKEDGRIIAYTKERYGMVDIVLFEQCMVKFGDEMRMEYQTGERIGIDKDWFFRLKISEYETDKGKGILCMPKDYDLDDTKEFQGKFSYISNDHKYGTGYELWYVNGFIHMKSTNYTGSYRVPAPYHPMGYDAVKLCCLAIEGIDYGINVIEKAGHIDEDNLYIIEKDGYFGFVKLGFGHDKDDKYYRISRWLSPCAFTGYVETEEIGDYYIVDQFGKKGVFYWNRAVEGNPELAYVIPCEYEKIEYRPNGGYNDEFYVEKAGMAGCIICSNHGRDTKWSTPLHRIEE